jgi:hypothetical protein
VLNKELQKLWYMYACDGILACSLKLGFLKQTVQEKCLKNFVNKLSHYSILSAHICGRKNGRQSRNGSARAPGR